MTSSASTTEKHGENSSSDPFTFRYPGRELLTTSSLLEERPELASMYVYDTTLTTGSLLYSCAGGIGVSREPFMVDMHRFIKTSSAELTLKSLFEKEYGGAYTKRKFYAARARFNEEDRKNDLSAQRSARLYLLWGGAGFKHRYREKGYDSAYNPTMLDYDGISMASRQSREKNLLFRKEGFSTLSESIINENMFIHIYLPAEFGAYGPGFVWNERALGNYARIANEFRLLGHKVCVSALFERRGRIFRDYRDYFQKFEHIVVRGFKVSKLTFEPDFSEIHFFNF